MADQRGLDLLRSDEDQVVRVHAGGRAAARAGTPRRHLRRHTADRTHADQRTAPDPLSTVGAACAADVHLNVEGGAAVAADGRAGRITYMDSGLVVWDCPACLYANADTSSGD